jgi:hypothetical protein
MVVESLLRRKHLDEFVQFAREKIPAELEMSVETGGFVLSQHNHSPETTIDAIREREIDDSISASKWDGGLRAISCEGIETSSTASR